VTFRGPGCRRPAPPTSKSTGTDPRIDAYIARSASFARPILRHLRALVREACPEAQETIKWGMPAFIHHGILGGMAAFKAHCTVWFWHRGMAAAIGRDGAKAAQAMGSFGRITRLADLPADRRLRRYFRQAAKLNESGAPARPRRKPRKPLPVPADLAAALKKRAKAAQTFRDFNPSPRREYIEWITEAKRPETRQKRVATTIKWLAAGKPRNWKYAAC
jgi:uncharacterized protein YdeI (YjbR/CyaY-like superfamily)